MRVTPAAGRRPSAVCSNTVPETVVVGTGGGGGSGGVETGGCVAAVDASLAQPRAATAAVDRKRATSGKSRRERLGAVAVEGVEFLIPLQTRNMSAVRTILGAVALAAAGAGSGVGFLDAQETAAVGDFVARSAAMPIASLRDTCLNLGDLLFDKEVPQIGRCQSRGVTALGLVGGDRWYSAQFARRRLLAGSAGVAPDTVAEEELVVLKAVTAGAHRGTRDTLLVPVWHYRFEPENLRSVTPEIASVTGGVVLMAIDECVNGTGGCSQRFLVRRENRWRAARLPFLDSLNRAYPDAINHGYHVDIRRMRGDAAVYSPNDHNCCPSRVAEFRLRLRGDALEIVQLRVRPMN